MTVAELREILEELDDDMEVRLAYQPHYPMEVEANHVKIAGGRAYICQNSYGGNNYAPDGLFEDNETSLEEIQQDEEW